MKPAYSPPAAPPSTGEVPGIVSKSEGARRFRYDSRFTAPIFITVILLEIGRAHV